MAPTQPQSCLSSIAPRGRGKLGGGASRGYGCCQIPLTVNASYAAAVDPAHRHLVGKLIAQLGGVLTVAAHRAADEFFGPSRRARESERLGLGRRRWRGVVWIIRDAGNEGSDMAMRFSLPFLVDAVEKWVSVGVGLRMVSDLLRWAGHVMCSLGPRGGAPSARAFLRSAAVTRKRWAWLRCGRPRRSPPREPRCVFPAVPSPDSGRPRRRMGEAR